MHGEKHLKIMLLSPELQLLNEEMAGIFRMVYFIVNVYLENWFFCTSACDVPLNDLEFLSVNEHYKTIDADVAL